MASHQMAASLEQENQEEALGRGEGVANWHHWVNINQVEEAPARELARGRILERQEIDIDERARRLQRTGGASPAPDVGTWYYSGGLQWIKIKEGSSSANGKDHTE